MGLDIVEYVLAVEDLFEVRLPDAELRDAGTPREILLELFNEPCLTIVQRALGVCRNERSTSCGKHYWKSIRT